MARFVIVNGPNKFDLMVSLLEGNWQTQKWVEFQVRKGHDIREKISLLIVRITGMSREDGSGESWNITFLESNNRVGSGYYSIKTRKGFLEIPDQPVVK